MIKKLSPQQSWLLIALFGIAVEIAIVTWLIYNPTRSRLCKPVVPQVIVELGEAGKTKYGKSLFIQYREAVADPLRPNSSTDSVRFSSCDIVQGRCIGARARYEMRMESARKQSLSVYLIDGKPRTSPSTIMWNGPAYPDRVTLRCNVGSEGQPTGCRLTKLEYLAELSNAHADKAEASIRRNDKCQPTLSRLLHGTSGE